MAREFSSNEVKELISLFNALLHTAARVNDYRERNRSDINALVDSMPARTACTPAIMAYLNRHEESDERNAVTEKLIKKLYIEKTLNVRLLQWSVINKQYTADIRKAVQDMEAATGALKWFFSSRDVKRRAEEAYFYLLKIKGTTYENDVSNALRNAQNVLSESKQIDRVWQDFLDDKKKYENTLSIVRKGMLISGYTIDQCAEIKRKYYQISKAYAELQTKLDTNRNTIRKVANYVRTEETQEMLAGIPVEELNRDHKGFRVGLIRDAGYETIADISKASVYDIYNIYGISYDTASNIKDAVSDMYESTYESTKIRLAVDKQTNASTKLVQELYKLRPYYHEIKQLEADYERAGKEIGSGIANVMQLDGGYRWLFYTSQEKNEIFNTYQSLKKYVEKDWLERINRLIYSNIQSGSVNPKVAWNDFKNNAASYHTILEEVIPDLLGATDKNYGLPEDLAREIEAEDFFPDGLNVKLRKYQEWGVKYILHQGNVLLGDEMGLGKTVQAIATMVSLRNTGAKHFMVICPASVLVNWEKEVARFSKLRAFKVHGPGRNRILKEWHRIGGVAITTYETISKLNYPDALAINLLVVDEAHYIKNPSAQRSENVGRLAEESDRILLMTGTALENNVDEMINLIRVINPAKADELNSIAFMSTAPQFRESVAPVYFRRKREAVAKELPEKIEEEQWIELTPKELTRYKEALNSRKYADIRRVSWNIDNPHHSSKGERLVELVNEATEEGRNVLVFSFFLNTIQTVRTLIGDKYYGTINGSVSPVKRQQIIDGFSDQAGKVLLAQIQAGGTGLNIQAASVVIICEPQLKPSLEDQAISRVYRMGQSASNVLVYRLLCENSIDERIMDLLAEKRKIFEEFAGTSIATERMLEIDDKSFGELIQEEIDRINSQNGETRGNRTRETKPPKPVTPMGPEKQKPGTNPPSTPKPPKPGPDTGSTNEKKESGNGQDSAFDQMYTDLLNNKMTLYKDKMNNRIYALYSPSISPDLKKIAKQYDYKQIYRGPDVSPVIGERSFIIYKDKDKLNNLIQVSKEKMEIGKRRVDPDFVNAEVVLQLEFGKIERLWEYSEESVKWQLELPFSDTYDLNLLQMIKTIILECEGNAYVCDIDCQIIQKNTKYELLCLIKKRKARKHNDPYLNRYETVANYEMEESGKLTILKRAQKR